MKRFVVEMQAWPTGTYGPGSRWITVSDGGFHDNRRDAIDDAVQRIRNSPQFAFRVLDTRTGYSATVTWDGEHGPRVRP